MVPQVPDRSPVVGRAKPRSGEKLVTAILGPYANLVWDARTVNVADPVFITVKTYTSIELALPVVGAVPPCHFGVTVDPSTWKVVGRYAVPPLVTKSANVQDWPVAMMVLSVVPLLPRILNVKLADALVV